MAVLQRTAKTLLVEGPTDTISIHRLLADRPAKGKVVIDHAGIIREKDEPGLGNKEKIIRVKAAAEQTADAKNALATLIDREWDGLRFADIRLEREWTPPEQGPSHFVTIGHSIENYHFDAGCISSCVKFVFPELCSERLISLIGERFCSALILAVVVSLVAKRMSIIKRLSGAIRHNHVTSLDGRYYISECAITDLLEREIPNAASMVSDVNASIDAHWDWLSGSDQLRWLAHGHIGDEIIWACVAEMALSCGLPEETAAKINTGHQKEKMHFCCDWLSKVDADKRIPLDQPISWMQENSSLQVSET